MELQPIIELLTMGVNGIIVLLVYVVWKMDRKLTVFIAESHAYNEGRDTQIAQIKRQIEKGT